MAQNYISRGEVITLTAGATHTSGSPYRISSFNGVALITVASGEQLPLQLEGVFELALAGVTVGAPIYITPGNALSLASAGNSLFGRAVTATDTEGKFYCRLLQG